MDARPSKRTPRAPLVLIGVALLLAALAALGAFRVPSGHGVAVQRGQAVRLYGPGWHWRLPFLGRALVVPLAPAPMTVEVTGQTQEGARVQLRLVGQLAMAEGAAARWFAATGWVPFSDGVALLAHQALASALADADGATWLSAHRREALAARLAAALTAAGAQVAELELQVPREENPAVAAVARSEAVKLTSATGRLVVVVGWDAADWQFVQPLMDAGRMPNLAGLVGRGARGTLRPEKPLLSPLIWTTFATGKRVSEHGIADFLVLDPATGARVPISSEQRKVHALWTILPNFGKRTDVVGWWATWPAEPIDGRMVSERVAYQLFGFEGGAANDGKVHPPELWPEVQRCLVRADEVSYEEVRRFVDISEQEYRQAWDSLPPDRRQEDRINHLRKVLAATRTYQCLALRFLDDPADLSLFYFEGTDTIGHLFAEFLPPRLGRVAEEDVRRFGKAMPAFYAWMDELLGQLLAKLEPRDTVVLLSDHGFYTGELRPDSDPFDWQTGAPQWHREVGMFLVAGGAIRRGELGEVSMYDVAPTLLALLGLPVADDMPGTVLEKALPAELAGAPVARLATFESLPRPKGAAVTRSAAADRERLKELAALGYISPGVLGEGETRTQGAAATRVPAQSTPSTGGAGALATQLYNLAVSLQGEGRLAEAKRKYLEAISLSPTLAPAYDNLAILCAVEGDYGEAFEHLARGFSRTRTMPAVSMAKMVSHAAKSGRLDRAAEVLAKLEPFRGGEAEYHAAWGRLYQARHDAPRALAAYQRALAINPVEGGALQGCLEVLREQGQDEEARAVLGKAFAAAGTSLDALTTVTAVALAAGWATLAEPVLEKLAAADPGNGGVLFNLGVCQAQLGKHQQAEASLRQAIARSPNNPGPYYNLGLVLGVEGRVPEALAALRKAHELGMNTALLHLAMARAHFFLKDMPATVVALKRALAVEPGNEEARKLLALLAQHGVDIDSPTP